MATVRPLVAGNWKMHGLRAALDEATALAERLSALGPDGVAADVMICPPATLLHAMSKRLAGGAVLIGAQDCHAEAAGAHTGDISAEMLADAGARAVIVGHSERRMDHGESDATVLAKARAAHRAGLTAIVCIGETAEERAAGRTLAVLGHQLAGSVPPEGRARDTVIAYEPVWAIGSGLTPSPADIAEAHGFLRSKLASHLRAGEAEALRLLYGGSVKPDNAAELLAVPDVDGALVGGASLEAADFFAIVSVYCKG